jgi:FkbM family methyltransferase
VTKHIHHAPHFDLFYDDTQRDGVVDEIVVQGKAFFDAFLKEVYDRWVKPDHVVVEVGAHVGTHTCYLSKRAAKVIAFEPQLPLFTHLCANLWLNDCRNVEPHRVALAAKCMPMKPNTHESGYWQSTAKAGISFSETGNPADFGTVEGRTLDSYAFPRVDFLKVDAEWNDLQVLLGARETIARCHPVIAFEDGDERTGPFGDLLNPLGYQIHRMERSNFLAVCA